MQQGYTETIAGLPPAYILSEHSKGVFDLDNTPGESNKGSALIPSCRQNSNYKETNLPLSLS